MSIHKRCPACGAMFECFAPEDMVPCWCERVDVPPVVLAALARRYRDCLCPQCLTRCAEEMPEGESILDSYDAGPELDPAC